MFFSILASLFHLVLISLERFIAPKYTLQYFEIVTKRRLLVAVALCWCLSGIVTLFTNLSSTLFHLLVISVSIVFSLVIIAYSHLSAYSITRRHQRQIRAEQIPAVDAAKFLEEKKAWKTTSIIVGFVFLSFMPGLLIVLAVVNDNPAAIHMLRPVFTKTSLLLNSLCNPIIYCFRSNTLRKSMMALLTGNRNL